MSLLPLTLPRATETAELHQDPLAFLARNRSHFGEIFVLRDDGPIFSRATDCNGTIAVFGPANHQALLSEMRQLALEVSVRLLFGDEYAERSELASLLQTYFQFRREVASPLSPGGDDMREELIALGTLLDQALRRHIKWCRQKSSGFA